MSLIFAVTTGTLYPAPTLEAAASLARIGVRDVELTLQKEEFRLNFDRRLEFPILPELCRAVDSGRLRVRSVHAPVYPVEHAFALRDRLAYLEAAMAAALQLGANTLVVHPFHLLAAPEAVSEWAASGAGAPVPGLLPGLAEALGRAQAGSLRLALENIQIWADEPLFNTAAGSERFLAGVGSPALGLTLDLFHAAFTGQLEPFLTDLPGRVFNAHLSDFDPARGRVVPGKGSLDWVKIARALRAMPCLGQACLELYNPPLEEIRASLDFLERTLAGDPPEPARGKLGYN